MGTKLHVFEIIVLSVSVVVFIAAIFILRGWEPEIGQQEVVPIVIWGPPFPSCSVANIIREMQESESTYKKVSYEEHSSLSLYGDLVEAIAAGRAPDLVLFDAAQLMQFRAKLMPISFERYSLRDYRGTFVEGAEVFILPDGLYALPLFADPMVLYWNRDLFTNAVVAELPSDWDTVVRITPKLSRIEQGADLTQSAIAFGEFSNVLHAKEILFSLLLQTGAQVVSMSDNTYSAALVSGSKASEANPELALQFFTDFSNPVKKVYSWNKSFDRSREAFAANKVAMYAGFASELPTIIAMNPNLNFDIAVWPQSRTARHLVTYGKIYGMGVVKNSAQRKWDSALRVARLFTEQASVVKATGSCKLPPLRRDLLSQEVADPYLSILAKSAILSRTVVEPPPSSAVDDILARMVNSVTSGSESPSGALSTASNELTVLLKEGQP